MNTARSTHFSAWPHPANSDANEGDACLANCCGIREGDPANNAVMMLPRAIGTSLVGHTFRQNILSKHIEM